MIIEKIWEDGDEIYVLYENGEEGRVNSDWWRGSRNCSAYEDEIKDIKKEQGILAACTFALENLHSGFLCSDCVEEEVEEEEEENE